MAALESISVSDLLARARGGDGNALNRLLETCRNYLCLVARARVETHLQAKFDASDIVQQTMLEAYRDFGQFQGTSEAEWLAWLKRALARNAADVIRLYAGTDQRQVRRERAIRRPGDDSAAPGCLEPSAHIDTPSQQLIRRERDLQVAEAITQLSPDHQQVIVLRNLQRLSFHEVAATMGRSRPATQMLWMRAIRKLQEILADDARTLDPSPLSRSGDEP